MTKKELSHLTCPYCTSHFHLNKTYKKSNNNIEFGTVFCHCDEFPIINSILYLHKNSTKNIINCLNNHQFFRATALALNLGKLKSFIFILFTQFNKLFPVPANYFINQIFIYLLWKVPKAQYKYYFSRSKEVESLLFFLPLTFKKPNSNSYWLDVGSGITNYYSILHHTYPLLTIISLEKLFQNIYLSCFFFSQKNTIYICSDFSYGPHFSPKSLDIITLIDSLPFIKNQRVAINLATNNSLKKNGLLFISSIPEHVYLKNFSDIFPLSSKLIRHFFPSPCQIFDEIKLCQQLFHQNSLKDSLLTTDMSPQFRYSLLWPSQKLPTKAFIPPTLLKNKYTLWQNPQILWKNKVY